MRYYARAMTALIEFLPLAAFLGTYIAYKDIYTALAVLMVAMPVAVIGKYLVTRTLDKMLTWSTVALIAFGSLTFYFRNPLFLYWKPTAFYWAVAIVFLVSQFVGERPLVQRMFSGLGEDLNLGKLTSAHWRTLNLAWIAFFTACGLLNLYVAYNFEEQTWVNFKVFGLMGLTIVFLIAQTLWLTHLTGDEDTIDREETD